MSTESKPSGGKIAAAVVGGLGIIGTIFGVAAATKKPQTGRMGRPATRVARPRTRGCGR